jgi:hypothetical protein
VFERWAETVCGLAPPRASRPALGTLRASRGGAGAGGTGAGANSKTAQSLSNLKQLPSVMREAAAAAAGVRLRTPRHAGAAAASPRGEESTGAGGVGGGPGGRMWGGGLYQRWRRSKQWQEGREASWGGAAGAESARDAREASMLYRDRYADRYTDSWERVLATVPSVFVSVGQESAALREDLKQISSSLSPLAQRHSLRCGSEPPPDVRPAGGSSGDGGEGATGGGGGGGGESLLATSHLSSDMLYSTSSRGGARVNLLFDPDGDTDYTSFREQLC